MGHISYLARFVIGDTVYDTYSGFTGKVTGIKFLADCVEVLVQPPVEAKYKWLDAVWLGEGRLELVKEEGKDNE